MDTPRGSRYESHRGRSAPIGPGSSRSIVSLGVRETCRAGRAPRTGLRGSSGAIQVIPLRAFIKLVTHERDGPDRRSLAEPDDLEHFADPAAQAAALADTLIGSVPALRLITTSREPLGVPGEVLVAVGGLAPPAAVELFVDRARAVRPGFTADERSRRVIADICHRLDGLPLASGRSAGRSGWRASSS